MRNLRIISLLLICLLFACSKEEFDIQNLSGNKIFALGHAGMGENSLYAMNSKESILACLNSGMDGSEMDVQMTRDSVLVAFHDERLEWKTELSGLVNETNWKDLQTTSFRNLPYLDYKIASLDEIFSAIEHPENHHFAFDCKLYTSDSNIEAYQAKFARALSRLIEKYGLQSAACIESQSSFMLSDLKLQHPSYQLYIYPYYFDEGITAARTLGITGISIDWEHITSEEVALAHSEGFKIAFWNVQSDRENREAIRKNPDFIQTDKLVNLRKLLR